MPAAPDLTQYPPDYLDAFAAYAHAAEGTPGVEIVEASEDARDEDAPHGENTEAEVDV